MIFYCKPCKSFNNKGNFKLLELKFKNESMKNGTWEADLNGEIKAEVTWECLDCKQILKRTYDYLTIRMALQMLIKPKEEVK